MEGIITVLHVFVSVLMIMIILLQMGKGAEMGSTFGGGYSQTIFGSSGPVSFLNKLTTVIAVVFMLTSLTLAFLTGQSPAKRVEVPGQGAPVIPGPQGGGN